MKVNFNNPVLKNVLGIGSAVVMGIVTVVSTLSDQKHAREFEEMKKALAELQNK